jgi:hypothetical protein
MGLSKSGIEKLSASLGHEYDIYILGIGEDFKKVKCPDGPVFIVKKLDKVFPLLANDYHVTAGVIMKGLKKLSARIGLDVKKDVVGLYEKLDNLNAELVAHYKAVYLEFVGNPCSKSAAAKLGEENSNIRHKASILRAMELEIGRKDPDVKRLSEMYEELIKYKPPVPPLTR